MLSRLVLLLVLLQQLMWEDEANICLEQK